MLFSLPKGSFEFDVGVIPQSAMLFELFHYELNSFLENRSSDGSSIWFAWLVVAHPLPCPNIIRVFGKSPKLPRQSILAYRQGKSRYVQAGLGKSVSLGKFRLVSARIGNSKDEGSWPIGLTGLGKARQV